MVIDGQLFTDAKQRLDFGGLNFTEKLAETLGLPHKRYGSISRGLEEFKKQHFHVAKDFEAERQSKNLF